MYYVLYRNIIMRFRNWQIYKYSKKPSVNTDLLLCPITDKDDISKSFMKIYCICLL